MRDMIERIDEVLDESEAEHSPEYLTVLQQKRYRTALERHAMRVEQERWILQGVKLGAVEATWDGQETWYYYPAEDCELWIDERYVRSLDELPLENAEAPVPAGPEASASD